MYLDKTNLKAEANLQGILLGVVDSIITIDEHGSIEMVNPSVERLFGYAAEEMVGRNINMLMPEPYHSAHDGYLHNYLTTGSKKIIGIGREVVGRRKDGSTFPMELAVSEVTVEGRRTFTGIVRDISERKAAEAALKGSENRIRAILETVLDGIITIDSHGLISTANAAALRLFGYNLENLVGHNINILMPEPYHSAHDGYLHNYLTTGKKKIIGIGREVVGRRKDGSTFPMELAVSEMEVGGERGFTGVVRDISARKVAEAALAENQAALEDTARHESTLRQIMALFSGSLEQEDVLQRVLSLLAEVHGFPVLAVYLFDEWSGSLNRIAEYAVPAELPPEIPIGSGLVGQAALEGKTLLLQSPDPLPLQIETGLFSVAPAMVVATPLKYVDRVLGVMVLASLTPLDERDRSFIERVSDQLGISMNSHRQYRDLKALTEQLKQRSKEIAEKNTLLQQANRLKSEFLANMSHELRTPLNAIIGFSEVIRDELIGPVNAEQADYLHEIFDSAQHLLSLINDILDLSKIEAGKMELYLDPVNLPEMLRNALSIIKEKAHAHNIQLEIKIADDIGELKADGRKLKQVIYNLLSNAVKFTPDGGRITLEAHSTGDHMRVSVTDTGIGITQEALKQLFRPFEQIDGSLSRKYEGTGLGLVMVKRLVELHSGNVSAESTPGVGSCFSFEIPYGIADRCQAADNARVIPVGQTVVEVLAPVSTGQLPVETKQGNDASPLVLLVEDNDKAALLLETQLHSQGYRTLRATSGEEGLRLAAEQQPALMVLDIMLPGIDGWEVMRRLRTDPALKRLPVVVVSIVADMKKGFELGAMDVLEKPVQMSVLLDAVQRIQPSVTEAGKPPLVLVVDDERKAVEVLAAQLAAAGFGVLKAYGGQEAIDLALSERPDLMILDLMMPEVTGFDVLMALRASEHTLDLPVLVLTAKTLTEEDHALLKDRVLEVVAKHDFDPHVFLAEVEKALRASPQTIYSTQRRRAQRQGQSRVLVVEDNKEQAQLLLLYLEDAGYIVQQAGNGREALERLNESIPDLIILDLLMPEMDGFAFLEAKAQREGLAGIPVMVLSAAADQMSQSPLAVDAVLSKPIRRSEILQVVGRILPQPNEGVRPRLLLVDDDPKAIKIVSSYFSDDAYEVFSAFSGEDGLELARAEPPDLIVLDLMMPGMSGFDVLSALKAEAATRDIPVIILTAKILSQKERTCLEQQVAVIAEKGKASRENILGQVQRLLKRHGM